MIFRAVIFLVLFFFLRDSYPPWEFEVVVYWPVLNIKSIDYLAELCEIL